MTGIEALERPGTDERGDGAGVVNEIAQATDVDRTSAPAPHDHGPVPRFEWIIQGNERTVIPHLRTLAPKLSWGGEHFDIREVERTDSQLPPFFMLDLQETAVGGVDFLPLPGDRTLMRLYTCSDLGAACLLENGDQAASGFAQIWLRRLEQLGFLASTTPREPQKRRLGFPVPERATGTVAMAGET